MSSRITRGALGVGAFMSSFYTKFYTKREGKVKPCPFLFV